MIEPQPPPQEREREREIERERELKLDELRNATVINSVLTGRFEYYHFHVSSISLTIR